MKNILTVATVNVTDLVVVAVFILIIGMIVVHLVKVYRKNPCGDCASAKNCQAFSKNKILKEYRKACKKGN